MICLSYGFVILSAAPEGRWNIRTFRRGRASQAPPGWYFELGVAYLSLFTWSGICT
jgi:hypothetical protein